MKNKQVKQMMIDLTRDDLCKKLPNEIISHFYNSKMVVSAILRGLAVYQRKISLTANQLKGK